MKSNYVLGQGSSLNGCGDCGLSDSVQFTRNLFLKNPMLKGDDVVFVQARVGAAPDGIFGEKTQAAVKEFQASKKLRPTGIVDRQTWELIALVSVNSGLAKQEELFTPIPSGATVTGKFTKLLTKKNILFGVAGFGAMIMGVLAANGVSKKSGAGNEGE